MDPNTGELADVSHAAMRTYHLAASRRRSGESGAKPDDMEQELFEQQIETASEPCLQLGDVRAEVRRCRRSVGEAARAAGVAAVAVPTPVLGAGARTVTPKDRYRRIVDSFGVVGREAGVCGTHVHIELDSDEQRVGVLDRIRPWLPFLLAVSANSPFWCGDDTGYASWRSQVWGRWPMTGAAEPYGDLAGYRAVCDGFLESGAALDEGMLYFDARLAAAYPTVEIRIADVCTDVDATVLVVGLSRVLVETAAQEWNAGRQPAPWRSDLLRAAQWRAAKFGLAGDLIHPVQRKLAPARSVFDSVLAHARDAVDEVGDAAELTEAFERLLAGGTGAARQRAIAEATGDLQAVVTDLIDRTESSWLRA